MNVEIIENGSFDVLARYGVPPESMPNRGATRMLSVRVPGSLAKALRIYCIHHDTSLTSTIMSEQTVNNRYLRGTYRNLRMHVRDMIPVLESMNGNVVVTLVVRSCHLPAVDAELEADYPPVPVEERIDVERKK